MRVDCPHGGFDRDEGGCPKCEDVVATVATLRQLASKAAAVDPSTPDREFTVYYAYTGCAVDQEARVATAWCREWADWIAATTPAKVLDLLDNLKPAAALTEHVDLMADEFQRIAACPGATDEIRDLCARALVVTRQKVPLIEQRDAAIRERDEALAQGAHNLDLRDELGRRFEHERQLHAEASEKHASEYHRIATALGCHVHDDLAAKATSLRQALEFAYDLLAWMDSHPHEARMKLRPLSFQTESLVRQINRVLVAPR